MPQFERITLIIESLPGARAQVQVNIPTPTPGMRLETPAHALAIDALGWLGKQPAVAGFVYGGLHTAPATTEQPTQQVLDAQTEAARSVLAERARQVAAEGWTPERDDEYTRGILGEAGGIYALHAFDPRRAKEVPEGWPWDDAWWKPKDPRTNLVKAGALILAEIERMDRSFAAQAKQGEQANG